jgi:hypothetical protein
MRRKKIPMAQFFISYCTEDGREYAEEVYETLMTNGIGCVMDFISIHSGENWRNAIDNLIGSSIGMIIIVTEAALKSSWVIWEWSRAEALGIKVVPLRFELSIPDIPRNHVFDTFQLNRDFTERNDEKWNDLIEELKRIEANFHVRHEVVMIARQKALTSFDSQEYKQAIDFLKDYDDPAADKALQDIMQSPAKNVMQYATVMFAFKLLKANDETGLFKIIDNLIECLSSADIFTRELALQALGQINDPTAFGSLSSEFTQVKTDNEIRVIIQSIANSVYPASTEILKNMLSELDVNNFNPLVSHLQMKITQLTEVLADKGETVWLLDKLEQKYNHARFTDIKLAIARAIAEVARKDSYALNSIRLILFRSPPPVVVNTLIDYLGGLVPHWPEAFNILQECNRSSSFPPEQKDHLRRTIEKAKQNYGLADI